MVDATISCVGMRVLARLGRWLRTRAGRAVPRPQAALRRQSVTDATSIGDVPPTHPRAASTRPEGNDLKASTIYAGRGIDVTTPLLVYDGDCAFCTSWARRLERRWHGGERAVAWQQLTPAQRSMLGVTGDAVWWVEPGRRSERAHLAVARALRASSGWPSWIGRLLTVPPLRWLAAAAYPLVARGRHRLPGGTPACRSR